MGSYWHDPASGPNPQDVYWMTYMDHLEAAMNAAAEARTLLTPEFVRQVWADAQAAAHVRREEYLKGPVSKKLEYVRLVPGMTSTDWRALETSVLQHLAHV